MTITKYFMHIDKICTKCGYRNKTFSETPSDMEIVACGKCGEILIVPNGTTAEEKEKYKEIINRAIEEARK